jgi:excisionase family DNA binding protein
MISLPFGPLGCPYRDGGTKAAEPEEITMTVHDQLDLWGDDERAVPRLLTVKEAGRVLSVSRSTIYELIAAGRLEVVHIGRAVRIPLDAVAGYVHTLRECDGPPPIQRGRPRAR